MILTIQEGAGFSGSDGEGPEPPAEHGLTIRENGNAAQFLVSLDDSDQNKGDTVTRTAEPTNPVPRLLRNKCMSFLSLTITSVTTARVDGGGEDIRGDSSRTATFTVGTSMRMVVFTVADDQQEEVGETLTFTLSGVVPSDWCAMGNRTSQEVMTRASDNRVHL